MAGRKFHSKLRPLAVIAVMMLAGLVMLTSPKRQLAIGYSSAPQAAECVD